MAEAVANQTQAPIPPLVEGEVTPAVKDEKVSSKLHVLVQREKQAMERERIAKQKEAEFEVKARAFSDRESKISEFESLKSTNPMKALELLGLSYQDLTKVALQDGEIPAEVQVRKVEEKFDSYIKAQEAAELQRAEDSKRQAAQREEQVISDFKSEINTFVDSDPKKYELVKFEGLQDYIYLTIDEHYNRTVDPQTGIGKIMSIKDAADKVESMLEKKYEDAKKLEKFKTQAPSLASQVVKQQSFNIRPQQPRTLTNQQSATPTNARTRPLTDDERIAKAIAYAKGLRP